MGNGDILWSMSIIIYVLEKSNNNKATVNDPLLIHTLLVILLINIG